MKNLYKSRIQIAILLLFCLRAEAQQMFCASSLSNSVIEDIIETKDRGYVLAGFHSQGQGTQTDFYIVRCDGGGHVVWSRIIGGGSGNESCYSVVQTKDNGYIMTGLATSFGMGSYDGYFVKLDSAGILQWSRTVGGANYDGLTSVFQTFDGGYIAAGSTKSYGAGDDDTYIVKLDSSGNLQWTKTVGGTWDDSDLLGTSIIQSSDSGYVIAGSTFSVNMYGYDLYIIKLDAAGNLLWTNSIGGTSVEEPMAIVETQDGGYVIGARSGSFGSGGSTYMVKLSSAGNMLWGKSFQSANSMICTDMIKTSDKGFAFSGYLPFSNSYDDGVVVKVDSVGNFQWARTFGASDPQQDEEPQALIQTYDGGFALAGATRNFASGPSPAKSYFVKLDANGNGCCAKSQSQFSVSAAGSEHFTGGTVSSGGSAFFGGVTFTVSDLHSICFVTTLNESMHEMDFYFYPNPVNSSVLVQFPPCFQNGSMELKNNLGQVVLTKQNLNENSFHLETGDFKNGIYFITILNEGLISVTKKLLVQH